MVSAEPLEDVGDVRCLEGLGDVVRVGDVFAGVRKLCCGAFGVCFFLDEGGHGLAEGGGCPYGFGQVPEGAEANRWVRSLRQAVRSAAVDIS